MASPRTTTRLGTGGRVVIPSDYREQLGIGVGDEIIVTLEENEIRIRTARQAIHRAQRTLKRYNPTGRKLSRELIQDRRRESNGE